MKTEKHIRSITKGITWRIIASLTTMILVYTFTKDIKIVFGIGFLDIVIKFTAYYLHERVWNSVSWGIEPLER
jgi:adenylylsulfate kinase